MEGLSINLIASALAQLGVGGIFAWLFIRKDKEKDDLAKRKDAEKTELVNKLIESYNENTKVQEGVKSSLEANTQVIRDNKTLTEKIYEELIKHGIN